MKKFLLERHSETSTWRGLVLLLTACGLALDVAQSEAIITAGLVVAGLLGVIFPDKRSD
jgi:hypothetical protein